MSDQSSFCSSDTTKSCPKPSWWFGCCHSFFFSSYGSLKKLSICVRISSSNEVPTPWFITCTYNRRIRLLMIQSMCVLALESNNRFNTIKMEAYIGCRTSSNLEEKKTKIKPIKVQKIPAQQLKRLAVKIENRKKNNQQLKDLQIQIKVGTCWQCNRKKIIFISCF